MLRRTRSMLLGLAIVASMLGSMPARAAHSVTNETVQSADGTRIAISIFQPEGASAANQVPVILHSHGWGGSRATTVASMQAWLDAGLGVVSIDQRGHGESGGQANVQNPDMEGRDVEAVIDRVAQLDWIEHNRDGNGDPIADDPVMGAIGGSYGGGYQTMGSLSELMHRGKTRFDALAPEITWYDLPESLGPQGVPRTIWTTLLYALAPEHASYIDEAYVTGLATGWFPDGTGGTVNLREIFYKNSPAWFADNGMFIDVPVLIGQGATDNLFNLNQGMNNFHRVVTPAARERSIFVAYNGGHVLPEVVPLSNNVAGNACFPAWTATEITFFKSVFAGQDPKDVLNVPTYNLTTDDGACLRTDSLGAARSVAASPVGALGLPAGAGAPIHLPLAEGPLTVAGIPHLTGTLTTAGFDARAFFALAVGTSPADARVVQNNVMPVREMLPVAGKALDIELPGVAVDVAQGETLYLTVSPVSTMFVGSQSRAPGAIVIQDATVDLPVLP